MHQRLINISGARVHNLKNVSLTIPKDALVVFTGISGSGKSSLAFDTIYAEGQRRYVESLSAYAKQFVGLMDKPDVDHIDGLSPAISIDQRSASSNPRSTVGTVTEIYDYLRLLYARIGHVHCPNCGVEVVPQTAPQIVESILKSTPAAQTTVQIFAPVVVDQKGEHNRLFAELGKAGYRQVRLDGKVMDSAAAKTVSLARGKRHRIEVLVRQIALPAGAARAASKPELAVAVELALDLGNGQLLLVGPAGGTGQLYSQRYSCPRCQLNLPPLEPRSFSFNSPAGACPKCLGLGTRLEVDPDLVLPNPRLTLAQGAIKPWARTFFNQSWYWQILKAVGEAHQFSLDVPVGDLTEAQRKVILYGSGERTYDLPGHSATAFPGVVTLLEQKHAETSSDYLRSEIGQYMRVLVCPHCHGDRLRPESLAVTVGGSSIAKVTALNVEAAVRWFTDLGASKTSPKLTSREQKVADLILREVGVRLTHLTNVGLGYLTLNRAAMTLSGGEAQRIRLATQISLQLSGVIYILDEPSIGLHQKDNAKLIATLLQLRDLGNTVIVVEHDSMMMLAADQIVDIGPGAGDYGGMVVAQGTPKAVMANPKSLTGRYLSGALTIAAPAKTRPGNGKSLVVRGAQEFNLKNIDVSIPLGKLVCLTGVSGSGKSTLMLEILVKALSRHFYRAKDLPGKHRKLEGVEHIDKVISIDQSPIGRTPRSNPATYTGVFTSIRDLFTQTPEAKIRGYDVGKFSFNAKGGRCETCAGEGMVKIEMQFLPDVYLQCEECQGRRYRPEVLDVHYQGKNISDVLDLPVEEALKFFTKVPLVSDKLRTLADVGLGYLKLGQPATTLSGGEAQRVKLATELSRRATGNTLYILDEPTTGLHYEDIKRLLGVLNQLVDLGNTVLIIEHNLDVIKCADWVIDLGPDGGDKGGEIVAQGIPRDIAKVKRSHTGHYLAEAMAAETKGKRPKASR